MFRRQALHCASQQLGGIGPLPSDGRWLLIFNHWGNHQCLSAAFRAQRTQSPSIGDSNDPSRNQGIPAKAASLSPHDGESVVDHFVNECESTGNPPQKAREALVIQQTKLRDPASRCAAGERARGPRSQALAADAPGVALSYRALSQSSVVVPWVWYPIAKRSLDSVG